MTVAEIALELLMKVGLLVVRAIREVPDSEELKAEATARLQRLTSMLVDDPFADSLQEKLDAAVPRDADDD